MASPYINQEFTSIRVIEAVVKGKPWVYAIEVDDGSWLVVKFEKGTRGASMINQNQERMAAVSTGAASKVLSSNEVAVLENFPYAQLSLVNQMNVAARSSNGKVAQNPLYGAVLDLKNDLEGQRDAGQWVKAEKVEGVQDLKSAFDKASGAVINKSIIQKIAKALNKKGGFEALGQIIAVDMFNGNGDRFIPAEFAYGEGAKASDNPRDPKGPLTLTVQNAGNIFIAFNEKGKVKPIGLDSFDPNGPYSDTTLKLADLERSMGDSTPYLGRILAPDKDGARRKFASDIIADLNRILGPHEYGKFKTAIKMRADRLDTDAAERLYDGMEQGIQKLKEAVAGQLIHMNGGRGAPQGLKDRQAMLFGR